MSFLGATQSGPLAVGAMIAGVFIVAAMFLTLYRLVKGETLPDRIVALDLLSVLLASLFVVLAVAMGFPAYLDTALVLSLIAFLSTVAFARYVERTGARRRRGRDGEGR